jgi:hypothetical protein
VPTIPVSASNKAGTRPHCSLCTSRIVGSAQRIYSVSEVRFVQHFGCLEHQLCSPSPCKQRQIQVPGDGHVARLKLTNGGSLEVRDVKCRVAYVDGYGFGFVHIRRNASSMGAGETWICNLPDSSEAVDLLVEESCHVLLRSDKIV